MNHPLETTKSCTKCGSVKLLAQFPKDKRYVSGRTSWCCNCSNAYVKSWRASHDVSTKAKIARRADPSKRLWQKAKDRAKRKGLPFSIIPQDVAIPEFCPVFGERLAIGIGRFGKWSPTLDAIIPEMGYIPGNVQVISFRANMMKNNATPEELARFALWVIEKAK